MWKHGGEDKFTTFYVDDLFTAGLSTESIRSMKSQLRNIFDVKNIGEEHVFLGKYISRHRSKRLLNLLQVKYVAGVLRPFEMDEFRHFKNSMESSVQYDEKI